MNDNPVELPAGEDEPAPPRPAGFLGVPGRGWSGVRRFFWAIVPTSSTFRGRSLQTLVSSRFLSESSQQMLTYAALIALGAQSSIKAALVMVATLLPQAMFGLVGGAVADWLPKRLALIIGYAAQAAMCFSLPFILGDSLLGVLGVIFMVYAVSQISAPAEAAVVPLIVEEPQYASANSWLSLSVVAGAVFGTVLVAPILVKLFDVRPVFYVAGAFFTLAALRLLALNLRRKPVSSPLTLEREPTFRDVFHWLRVNRVPFLMLSLGVLSGAANFAMVMLAPRYTAEVLNNDPTNAVYIFWTSGFGLFTGLLIGPYLIRLFGAWNTAVFGFVLITIALFLLGIIGPVVDVLRALRLLAIYKLGFLPIGDRLAAASLVALPLGFGITIATLAAQTYLNATVPEKLQGRVFSIYLVLRNGSAVIPLLIIGGVAELTGVQPVTALAPLIFLALALYAARMHTRWQRSAEPGLSPA